MSIYAPYIIQQLKNLMISEDGQKINKGDISNEMIKLTNYYSHNWYQSLNFPFENMNLGNLVDYKINGYDVGLYRYVQILIAYDKYFKKNPKRRIGIIESLTPQGWLAKVVLKGKKPKDSHDVYFGNVIEWIQQTVMFSVFYRISHKENVEVDFSELRPQNRYLKEIGHPYIFFASLNTYLSPMIPLLNSLCLHDKICLVVPRIAKKWVNMNKISDKVNIIYLENLFDDNCYKLLHNLKKLFQKKFKKDEKILREFFDYKGVSFWEIIRPGFSNIYNEYFPHCIIWTDMAEYIMEKFKPKKIIFGRLRRSIENTFLEVAKRDGIETIQLQHGHFNPESKAWFYGAGKINASDKICVFGKWHKNKILNVYGKNIKDKIIITGNPKWDKICEYNKKDVLQIRKNLYSRINLPIRNKWIMFATQYAAFGDMIKTLQYPLLSIGGSNIIIKMHPAEQKQYYYKMLKSENKNKIKIIQSEYDQYDILRAMDIVIVHSSTVFIESLLVNTPVIFSNINNEPIHNFNPCAYGLPIVKKEKELIKLIQELIFNEQFEKEYLKKCNSIISDLTRKDDAQATNRILDVIYN